MKPGQETSVRWALLVSALCAAALLWLGEDLKSRLGAAGALAGACAGWWFLRGQRVVPREEWAELAGQRQQLAETVQTQEARLVVAAESLKDQSLEQEWSGQALEHQLRYANLIINNLGEPLLVISKAGRITRVNPAALRLTGYSEPELISAPLHKILRAAFENMAVKVDPLPGALAEGRELLDWTGYLVNQAGTIAPVLFNLYPLRDQEKVVAGIMLLRLPPKPAAKPPAART